MSIENYNVINNECIKAAYLNGEVKYVSIREAFRDAHLIRGVRYTSAIEEYSILRLLIVIAMDCYNYEDVFAIQEALDANHFDMDKFDSYVSFCEKDGSIFDLFDKEKPFLQTKNFLVEEGERTKAEVFSVSKIFETMPTGRNHCIYTPLHEVEKFAVLYRDILPALAAISPFTAAGGRGYSDGINHTPPYYMLVNTKIENLYQKIVANCVAVNDDASDRACSYNKLPPSWRANKIIKKGIEQLETSILDGMTFEARTIKLIPDNGYVKKLYYGPGILFKSEDGWLDPHVAYAVNKKKELYPMFPRFVEQANTVKRAWQEFGFIFSSTEETTKKNYVLPAVFKNVITTKNDFFLIDIYGIVGCGVAPQDKTRKVKMVRERLNFPYEILQNKDKMKIFADCTSFVEKIEPMFTRKRFTINSEKKTNYSKSNILISLDLQGFLDEVKDYLFSDLLSNLKHVDCEDEVKVHELYRSFKEKLLEMSLKYYNEKERDERPSTQDMYYLTIDKRFFVAGIKKDLVMKEEKQKTSKK